MSAIGNNCNHLARVAHPSNDSGHSRHRLQSSNNDRVVSTVSRTAMGGMVSAINAVLCGSQKQQPEEYDELEESKASMLTFQSLNERRYQTSMADKITNNGQNSPKISGEWSYRTAEGSESDYADAVEAMTFTEPRVPPTHQYMDIPYMDEHSDISPLSSASHSLYVPRDKLSESKQSVKSVNNNDSTSDDEEALQDGEYYVEVIDVSEGEYSADEEQEEGDSEASEIDEMERVDSETEDESIADHVCDSDCEHSEFEFEDESEPCSADEEDHICDSDCDHSEVEGGNESEYDSEEIVDSDDTDDDEAPNIDISENEHSCDEEQASESEGELVSCECDSTCASDCDGNHHECSSQCGCNETNTEDDHENEPSILESNGSESHSEDVIANGTDNHHSPILSHFHSRQSKFLSNQPSLPLNVSNATEVSPKPRTSLTERNNNRLQRNHSQRIPLRNDGDIMGELKTAIDARVRRSASCRETTSDYRKRYARLSNDDSNISENFNKLELKDRESRRMDRRTRLRTLELKREQCLDEVRDGTEHNVTDRIYKEAAKIETT